MAAITTAKSGPLRASRAARTARPSRAARVVTRAGFFGSAENIIMVASTTAFLGASRFGLAPSSTKTATAGLKLVPQSPGLKTGDPAGFSAADVLGAGALGHGIGVGIILGLRATGKI